MWNADDHFYDDLTLSGIPITIKTVGGFWPLIAGVADSVKAGWLSRELDNENTFNRKHRVPSVAAGEVDYDPKGGYWRGAIWPSTNTMVIRGLENYGLDDQAAAIALNHLKNVVSVFEKTHTIWENYAPDTIAPGLPARPDFVGWSGIGPIDYFIEYAIGIKADAPHNTIVWTLRSNDRVGVNQFWFGGTTTDLMCGKPDSRNRREVRVSSDRAFTLKMEYDGKEITKKISAGKTVHFQLKP